MSNSKKLMLYIIGIIAFILAVVLIFVFTPKNTPKKPIVQFTPPSFDENVSKGKPLVSSDLGYEEFYQEGFSYKVSIWTKIKIENKNAILYFTNHEENTTWIKVRLLNQNDEVIGESGLVRPGEYLKDVKLKQSLNLNDVVKVKFMGYVPDTYYSAGAYQIKATVISIE